MLREQGGDRLEETATLGCKHLRRAEAQSDRVEKLWFRSLYSAQTQTASWGCEKVVRASAEDPDRLPAPCWRRFYCDSGDSSF